VATAILTYIIDQNAFVEFRSGFVFKRLFAPSIADMRNDPLPQITDRATNQRWGAYGINELQDRYKWNYGLTLTKFLDNFLGADHEFKVGAEYGTWNTSFDRGRKMPHSVGWFNGTPWYYHDTQPYVGRITLNQALPLGQGPRDLTKCWRISAFIQDNVKLGKRLSLNLGLRYDHENASRPEEVRPGYVDPNFNGLSNILLPDFFATYEMVAPEIKNFFVLGRFQPRIGVVYDIFGNGRTAFKASFARYYDSILGHNLGNVHPFDKSVTFYWYDLNRNGIIDLPPADSYTPVSVPRLITDPEEIKSLIDPNLKAPYVDEFIAGIQHELFRDFSLTAQFIYKENKSLQETLDLANPLDGDMWLPYTVTEPGDDGKFGTSDDRNLTVYALKKTAESPLLYRTNIDDLKRKYWAVEFNFFKRMSGNWQFSGTVTYSKQYGNIGSGYYDSQGGRGFYTDPNNLINMWGRGTWDRPLQIKLMGTVKLPYGFNVSTFYRYMSGAPVAEGESSNPTQYNRSMTVYFPKTVDGFAVKNASVKVKAEPIGSKRNSPTSLLDLRVEKVFRVPFGTLGFYVDVFNALGSYRLSMNQDPGGYIYADGSFSRYPTYGQVLIAEGARVIKLTLRYTFGI
jgi:outer membrane receptor protein involved in Fe transport